MAKKSKPKRINKKLRDWLNPASSADTGHVHLYTEYFLWQDDHPDDCGFDCSFDISDCSRKIFLDFSIFWHKQKELDTQYKARKKKIETLRKHIDELEFQLDAFYEYNS